MRKNKLIIIIPARGNSKEIKKKNFLLITKKKRLIDYTIEDAIKLKPDQIILSSEDNKILNYCLRYKKIIIHKRNKKLSNDNVHTIKVVINIIKDFKIEKKATVCMMLPTYPLRDVKKIKKLLKKFIASKKNALIGIKTLGVYENNLRFINKKNNSLYAKNIKIIQRQNAKEVFAVNGSFFASRAHLILKNKNFHHKKNSMYLISDDKNSVDINKKKDLKKFKYLLKRQ
jgi:CMP-N,N'-diacetyllegionaminic acid synthase